MTFVLHPAGGDGKCRVIQDTASDLTLTVDTDDVDPDDVTEEELQALVDRLNARNVVLDMLALVDECAGSAVTYEYQAAMEDIREQLRLRFGDG